MRARLLAALGLVTMAILGGCQALLGLEEGQPRGAGGASSSSAGGGGASSTASSAGSTSATSSTASSSGSSSSTSSTSSTSAATTSSSGSGGGGPTCSDGTKNGNETGVDCGGADCPMCPTVLLLATGGPSLALASEYHPGGPWLTTMLPATTVDAPGLALTTAGQGVGLIRNATAMMADPLNNDVQAVIWSAGVWGTFTAVGGGAKTQARPAIVSVDTTAQAAFQGVDFKHDFAMWTGLLWAPTNDPVGGAGQSYGPTGPDLTAIGLVATAAFIDGAIGPNHLTVQDRSAGVWQPKVDLAANAPSADFAISPTIAAMTGGAELVVLYVRSGDKQVMWLARTAGSWSVATPIVGAFTADRVALTGLPGGAALMAFRGTDGKLYTSRFAAGAWSAPIKAAGETLIASTPALAGGVGGAEAELAYVDTAHAVYHARLISNAWTSPTQAAAAAGITQVAIASHP